MHLNSASRLASVMLVAIYMLTNLHIQFRIIYGLWGVFCSSYVSQLIGLEDVKVGRTPKIWGDIDLTRRGTLLSTAILGLQVPRLHVLGRARIVFFLNLNILGSNPVPMHLTNFCTWRSFEKIQTIQNNEPFVYFFQTCRKTVGGTLFTCLSKDHF